MTENLIKIAPVSDTKRPLWSVVIPTYNCAEYLKETLRSVLQQDQGKDQMEIIVVDDHSTKDDPEAVVKQHGNGRVRFIRQEENVGKSRNYASGIQSAKGQYIHLLHGDDTIDEHFYQKIGELFEVNPSASAAFCRCNYINATNVIVGETELIAPKKGVLANFINKIAVWQCIQPPSIVMKREVYEQIGGYDHRLKYIEDWEFYVRCALHFEFAYTPEKLANYRVFPDNSSNQSIKEGKRVATVHQVISIIDSYLPEDIKKEIHYPRQQAAAVYLLNFIPKIVASKDLKGFLVFSKAFFRYNRNIRLVGRWMRFIFQYKKFL
jgi:glycosyltransferase involved in cell wall biosynthesis